MTTYTCICLGVSWQILICVRTIKLTLSPDNEIPFKGTFAGKKAILNCDTVDESFRPAKYKQANNCWETTVIEKNYSHLQIIITGGNMIGPCVEGLPQFHCLFQFLSMLRYPAFQLVHFPMIIIKLISFYRFGLLVNHYQNSRLLLRFATIEKNTFCVGVHVGVAHIT